MTDPTPISCSLERSELSERHAQMARLGSALIAVRAEGARARLRFPGDRREDVDDFVAAESSCCPFFSFERSERDGEIELTIGAPEDAEWAVRGLVAEFVSGWRTEEWSAAR